jgi:GT2 family glycosyltransferase
LFKNLKGPLLVLSVSVIIVNFNGVNLLPDCLDGLEAQTRPPDEVILIDNGSVDDSTALIRDRYSWVHLLAMDQNLGFAAGNNRGIRESKGDVVVLLNNDTVPSAGFVEAIVQPLEDDPSLSAVAGTLLFSDNEEFVASSGIDVVVNGLSLDYGTGASWRKHPATFEVFGPSAGAAAYRKSALEDVDLFPEPFFLYLEDADLAWRLRLRGHRTVGTSSAWVLHEYSASSIEGSPLKNFHLSRNRVWTLLRCWPDSFWSRFWWPVLKYEIGAVGFGIITRNWALLRGRILGWTAFARLRPTRRRIQSRSSYVEGELLYWLRSAPTVRNIFRGRSVIRTLSRSRVPDEDNREHLIS